MGGSGAFDTIEPAFTGTLRQFTANYIATHGVRPLVALDMSCFIEQVKHDPNSLANGVTHQTFFRRMAALIKIGLNVVCVFDGPLQQQKLRHKTTSLRSTSRARQFGPMVGYARHLAEALQLPTLDAPAEAEALCAWLQREGHVDFAFSQDADTFANGATKIVRYVPNSAAPAANGGDRQIEAYEVGLETASTCAMMSLIVGNDWEAKTTRLGARRVPSLCQPAAGFVQGLDELAELWRRQAPAFEAQRAAWRTRFVHELRHNSQALLNRRSHSPVPQDFPDIPLYAKLRTPARTYSPNFMHLCRSARSNTFEGLHTAEVLIRLEELWTQGPMNTKVNAVSEDKMQLLFRNMIAPLLLTSVILQHDPVLSTWKFKPIRNGTDVQVVEATSLFYQNPQFFLEARLPRHIFDLSPHPALIEPPARISKAEQKQMRIVSENSTISFPRAAKAATMPLLAAAAKNHVLPARPTSSEMPNEETTQPALGPAGKGGHMAFIKRLNAKRAKAQKSPTKVTKATASPNASPKASPNASPTKTKGTASDLSSQTLVSSLPSSPLAPASHAPASQRASIGMKFHLRPDQIKPAEQILREDELSGSDDERFLVSEAKRMAEEVKEETDGDTDIDEDPVLIKLELIMDGLPD